MLSGNGRHRRPRQAPALIVAAGVAGSAIAIPLLGATSASAASTATWDKLAECESGGSWSADPGNGYYGGLQFSQEMWEQYGGLDFAPRADQASRSQQIAVAEKVLDDQGPRAWPVCSVTSGLTRDAAAAKVDPGAALPTPSASAGDSGSGDAATGDASPAPSDAGLLGTAPSDAASPDATDGSREKNHDTSGDTASNTPDDSKGDKSGRSDATSAPATPAPETSAGSDSSAPPVSGRHRGDAAGDEAAGSSRADDSSGRHASRGDESGRKDANTDERAYTVRPGDSLWGIADAHDVDGGWAALYAENKKTVGADPDLILPGQSLDLGLESGEK
ncbi:LysM peptidoglycan-binding domain-containing protein [Streptomyces antnestii]|uniref:LysM peptidoglycan-binding domain-containing protein n=1 Tax=Streptomyces antnestii TaxID=2494256 RepID=A0A3S2VQU4_9ACTN|nr:transglycosylase family protein [Streptomyces sp. San01]RVU18596.1 LysM peptidoglycan-binding domain-containing protein [Streptomyces sp. San01]